MSENLNTLRNMGFKRYLVFGFYAYIGEGPKGGWNDCQGVYYSLDDAEDAAQVVYGDYFQVVDLLTGKIVSGNNASSSRQNIEELNLKVIDDV